MVVFSVFLFSDFSEIPDFTTKFCLTFNFDDYVGDFQISVSLFIKLDFFCNLHLHFLVSHACYYYRASIHLCHRWNWQYCLLFWMTSGFAINCYCFNNCFSIKIVIKWSLISADLSLRSSFQLKMFNLSRSRSDWFSLTVLRRENRNVLCYISYGRVKTRDLVSPCFARLFLFIRVMKSLWVYFPFSFCLPLSFPTFLSYFLPSFYLPSPPSSL